MAKKTLKKGKKLEATRPLTKINITGFTGDPKIPREVPNLHVDK
jgi:hypothetical protein